ncbi:unnamed protein product [Vicia faba]|uniref:Uncharacterized protein n=1 Tax=Vicia faba TaxID=3906 RepID=A0AAV1ATF4_VICFA|nr:unnamed protein product [Vicia faba]
MSVTYLIFFLAISYNAYCTTLPLTSTSQDIKLVNKPHFSIKADEIKGFESLPNNFPTMNQGKKMKTLLVNNQKSRKERYNNQKVLNVMRKDSVASETKTLGSVHRKVSCKIPREKISEFNLDYSLPKVHPPSNN